MIEVKKYR